MGSCGRADDRFHPGVSSRRGAAGCRRQAQGLGLDGCWETLSLCRKDPVSEARFGFSCFTAVKCAEYAVLQS